MIAQLTENDWTHIGTIVGAVIAAILTNWTALNQQTKALRKMHIRTRKETHRDLEAIRVRVAAVESAIEGILGRRREGDARPSQSGGDPETGHLPPNSGGHNQD